MHAYTTKAHHTHSIPYSPSLSLTHTHLQCEAWMWHALFHNDEIIIKLRSERKEERTNREMMIESLLFDCSLTAQIWLWNCVCACVFMFLCKHCPASNKIGCKQQQQHSVMAATKSKCVNALTIFIWYHKRDTICHNVRIVWVWVCAVRSHSYVWVCRYVNLHVVRHAFTYIWFWVWMFALDLMELYSFLSNKKTIFERVWIVSYRLKADIRHQKIGNVFGKIVNSLKNDAITGC